MRKTGGSARVFRISFCFLWLSTHREKLCFTQFSRVIYWNRSLAASDLFLMFTQSINIQLSQIKKYICLKKDIHKIDRWEMVAPSITFYGQIWVGFCLKDTHHQIKLQRLQIVWTWTFGSLVHQINFLQEFLKLKQNFLKNKVVTGKTPFFVVGPFCTHYTICLLAWQFCIEIMRFQS